ncbi:hypothetical protein SD77_0874 [Bacillus badius]|uniref:Ribose 5-phosphate isomerase B n=1 Tax=Bacillus badius TaxID=1455 RepID=A0ABR5ATE9_BACBA|nr:hypothetical protein SD78_2612 [Bacillus badius]KIL77895.1 hypothetical protein SD77_0874 [Bacillus badius]
MFPAAVHSGWPNFAAPVGGAEVAKISAGFTARPAKREAPGMATNRPRPTTNKKRRQANSIYLSLPAV